MGSKIESRVVADSVSPAGCRLTTMVCTFPRIILAEVNTHRALSRNSASSRAIPVETMIRRVEEDPFIPHVWTTANRGMQGGPALEGLDATRAANEWLVARDEAVFRARRLLDLRSHKQVANRLLEPFMWHTAIISATEWGNMLALRDHPAAEPHFQLLAATMLSALAASTPTQVQPGEWHLPFGDQIPSEVWGDARVKVATARCARISYLTHEGTRDTSEDLRLHDQLREAGHWSPFEHCARALPAPVAAGNFVGWHQYRKDFSDENRQHPAIR